MTILTATEAGNVLRISNTDANLLSLLPLVDVYIKNATGRDWAGDASIDPLAKAAARLLVVMWFENPGMMGSESGALGPGLRAVLTQLEARAAELAMAGVSTIPLAILAFSPGVGAVNVAITVSPVIIFSVEMDGDADSAVKLIDPSGSEVAITNNLDVTSRILTISPDSNLLNNTRYIVRLTACADVYGRTITDDLYFWTV